jgi:hypothetical protein
MSPNYMPSISPAPLLTIDSPEAFAASFDIMQDLLDEGLPFDEAWMYVTAHEWFCDNED